MFSMVFSKALGSIAVSLVVGFLVAGCGSDTATSSSGVWTGASEAAATSYVESLEEGRKPDLETPKGDPPDRLIVNDLEKGTGPAAGGHDELIVLFTSVRWDGEPFQSSWDSGKPEAFNFRLNGPAGLKQVIPAWEKGLQGMKAGEVRELLVPPQLLYYPGGWHPKRPLRPEDSLVYVVYLVQIHE